MAKSKNIKGKSYITHQERGFTKHQILSRAKSYAEQPCLTVKPGPLTYEQQVAIKHDDTKLRMDLVPVSAITALAAVLTFGAKKYSDRNWEKGFKWTRVYGALLRHLLLWYAGRDKDEESGLSHLDHILCNAAFLKEFETTHKEFDDRVKHAK